MAVLEVLAEMIGSVELLARIALAEFVHILEMANTVVPVLFLFPAPGKLLTAVSTNIRLTESCGAVMKSAFVPGQGRAGPAVPPDMERVLMPLGFVLVLEPVAAECTAVLFLGLMRSQFRLGLKLFGFLGATFAHIRTLELGGQATMVFGYIADLPWGGDGPRDLCWQWLFARCSTVCG